MEESLHVDVGEVEARLCATLGKLLKVESAGAVVIHDLEDTADSNYGSGSSLEHLGAESLDKVRCGFCGHGGLLLHLSLLGSLLAEDSDGELLVVQAATAITIVTVKEGAKLIGREVHAAFFEHALELVEIDTARVHHIEELEHLHEAGLLGHLGI